MGRDKTDRQTGLTYVLQGNYYVLGGRLRRPS